MEFDCSAPYCRFFREICEIPHGSGNEKAISDYLVDFAKTRGLAYMQDDLWNVIIRKPGTPGSENAPVLCIHAHTDMVCEKNKNTVHDFTKDPLRLMVTEDGLLRADGTTLGADDGAGVAYMLAILDDDSLSHPPLECIFTTQEETGMYGAKALKAEDVKGHRMITLDGGGETCTLLTSSGGCRVKVEKTMVQSPNAAPCFRISIRGLSGGHSGGEIHKEKGNANKLMARLLKEAMLEGLTFRLCGINGGLKENAIPRECDAVIAFPGEKEALVQAVQASAARIAKELEFSDSGFSVEVSSEAQCSAAFTEQDTRDAVDLLFLLPNGFQARSMAIEGLTMTSLNLGVVFMQGNTLVISATIRSMLASCIDHLYHQIGVLCRVFGAQLRRGAQYPGWSYNPKSPLREIFTQAVRELYGREPTLKGTHGGCETGIFSALHPDMDIITLGPVTRYIHTPDEELDLASFDRTYRLLTNIISRCG